MIKRIVLFNLLVFLVLSYMFSTDFQECFSLNSYFNLSQAEIQPKIKEYEQRLVSDPQDYYANLAIGILYTAISSPGDNPDLVASQNIIKYTEKFLKREPGNPFALVYLGLGHSLVSRDSNNPVVKIFEVNNAISTFDKAVNVAKDQPVEWFVRYMRANFFMNLPKSFNKRKDAESDYAFVRKVCEDNPNLEGFMISAYYYLGELQKSKGDINGAADYWNKSVSLNKKLEKNVNEAKKAQKEIDAFNSSNQ